MKPYEGVLAPAMWWQKHSCSSYGCISNY